MSERSGTFPWHLGRSAVTIIRPARDEPESIQAHRTTAMMARNAVILRLLGPLIQIACLILWLKFRDRGMSVAGVPVEYLLYGGIGFGLTLVVVGLAFTRSKPRPPRDLV